MSAATKTDAMTVTKNNRASPAAPPPKPPSAAPIAPKRVAALELLELLRWLDGRPLREHIEPYRRAIFTAVLDRLEPDGRPRYNLALMGRAKNNSKSADLVLAALYALLSHSPGGSQCYLIANDEGQAGDDLSLAKKLLAMNPLLTDRLRVKQKMIERKDGRGFLEILPANDVSGTHGKTYRFCGFDEVHGYRTWDLFEALALDPTRPDSQQWITSYASLYHAPGRPLYDLLLQARRGTDARMFFSWYAADFCTDPDFASLDPESRANPSRASWADPNYLTQQQARLPSHKYRRLHLNLPGLPEGSAFQVEPVVDAIDRGVSRRPPEEGHVYHAFVDMSGGSSDDAVLAIGHADPEGRGVLDLVMDQGPKPPFDPRKAVARFCRVLTEYRVAKVTGDRFAGETFRVDFREHGIDYLIADRPKSELYERFEPLLNSHRVVLLDVPLLEQQLLGLQWRGGKIDHPGGEHDDWSNAAVGVVVRLLAAEPERPALMIYACGPAPVVDARTGRSLGPRASAFLRGE